MNTFIPDGEAPDRPTGGPGNCSGDGTASEAAATAEAAAAAAAAAEARLWPQARLWLQRGYRIIVADVGSRRPREKQQSRGRGKPGRLGSSAELRAAALASWRARLTRLMRRVWLLVAAGAVFVWHATPPGSHAGSGHNGCWGAGVLSRAQLARAPRPTLYNWGLIAEYVEAERRALSSVGRGAYFLDTHLADQLRPDALVSSVLGYPGGNTRDCFHPCLPGLPDLWNEQLWNLLLTLDADGTEDE